MFLRDSAVSFDVSLHVSNLCMEVFGSRLIEQLG